ncbi:MAG TPA: hypothetical protein VHA52_09225, partial [Candidatus Babeliaceae bacterium]|nr:hypothetical protein [Candidatus Babeliaceae bacterium]
AIKPVVFVQEILKEITYVYRTADGLKKIKAHLLVPDYAAALEKIFREQYELQGKPMFIHATRI